MLHELDKVPPNSDLFRWADFIEIRALCHPDKCYSRGDLAGVMGRARDVQIGPGAIPRGDEETGQHAAIASTKWHDTMNFIDTRVHLFAPAYPFLISEDRDTLTLVDANDLTAQQKLYLCLLICANLRHIPANRRNEVTRLFEEYSFQLFERFFPNGSEVRPCWARGGADAPYQGALFAKYTQIASDIKCTPNFKAADFHPNDNGDGGIDMIAWNAMGDLRDNIPIAFAQNGCSNEEWTSKQLEASPAKLGRQLVTGHPWATYYFLPQDLRRLDGDWEHKHDIGAAIIVDRLRIIKLSTAYDMIEQLVPPPFLNEALTVAIA